ncbi:MAG: hypothetical protein LBN43_03980 [Oscillospiraceae bacterium]|jgi:hypothetical protein|nr:hypothetical protein [Oscillospiraceae bacterium]
MKEDYRWSSNPKNMRKVYIITGTFSVLIVSLAVVLFVTQKGGSDDNFDLGIIYAAYEELDTPTYDRLYALAASAVNYNNANPYAFANASVSIDIKSMYLAPWGEDFNPDEYVRFGLSESDGVDGYTVFILDDKQSRIYGERGDFDDLSAWGFDLEDGIDYRVYIGDFAGQNGLGTAEYACLQTWKDTNDTRIGSAARFVRSLVENDG